MTTNTKPFIVYSNWTVVIETIYIDRSRDSYRDEVNSHYATEQSFATLEEAQAAARAICGENAVFNVFGDTTRWYFDVEHREFVGNDEYANAAAVVVDQTPLILCAESDDCPF